MVRNKFVLISLLAFAFVLAACGGSAEPVPETDGETSSNTEPTEVVIVVEEATEPVVEEPEPEAVRVEGIPVPTTSDYPSGAEIMVYDFGDMVLHAFVNPPQGAGNGTYVIESANTLVLIDAHFAEESSRAFREYVDAIGKPIDRIYATHEHPDHINGLGNAFADIESYASAEVVELAAQAGITIDNVVGEGSETIDGINYEYQIFKDAESEEALVIKFPDYAVMATGDLIYNNYHMVMNPNIPNWIDQLAQLEAMTEYELLLSGHGAPADRSVYAESTDYLETAWEIYNEIDDPDAFQAALVEAYPDYQAPFFLGLAAQRLYPKP